MFIKKIGILFVLFGFICTLQAFDLEEISKNALKEHKLILLSVESENCRYCEKMNKDVFTPDEYTSKINTQYVQKIVKIQNINLPKNLKVQYYPTNFILDPKDMSIVDEFVGYMKPKDFIALLDIVYEQEIHN